MASPRNVPCPCGSGLKYKRCCQNKQHGLRSPVVVITLLLVVLGAGIAIVALVNALNNEPPRVGPAPPGQVWSPEHGHYH